MGGPADLYVCPKKQELPVILGLAKKKGLAVTVIGNGSNLLVGDKGIRGLVIEVGAQMNAVEVQGNILRAQAGALLSQVAAKAAAAGLGGMEFAAGIPGSMGGAVTMNAGAYGGEMKDVIRQVTVLTQECEQNGTLTGGTGSVLPAQLYSQESFSGTGGRVVPDAGTGAGDPCKDGRTQGKSVWRSSRWSIQVQAVRLSVRKAILQEN